MKRPYVCLYVHIEYEAILQCKIIKSFPILMLLSIFLNIPFILHINDKRALVKRLLLLVRLPKNF